MKNLSKNAKFLVESLTFDSISKLKVFTSLFGHKSAHLLKVSILFPNPMMTKLKDSENIENLFDAFPRVKIVLSYNSLSLSVFVQYSKLVLNAISLRTIAH